ncbi:hypothetical protein ACHAPJ_012933 [Fusarium lateritium]
MVNRRSSRKGQREPSSSVSPKRSERHHPYTSRSRSQSAAALTSTSTVGSTSGLPTLALRPPPGFAGASDNVAGFPPPTPYPFAETALASTLDSTSDEPIPTTRQLAFVEGDEFIAGSWPHTLAGDGDHLTWGSPQPPAPSAVMDSTLGSTSGIPALNSELPGFGHFDPTPLPPPPAVMTSTTASGSASNHFALNPEAPTFTGTADGFRAFPPPTPATAYAELHRVTAQDNVPIPGQPPVGYGALGNFPQQPTQQWLDLPYLDNLVAELPPESFLTEPSDNPTNEQSEVQHEQGQQPQPQPQHNPGPGQTEPPSLSMNMIFRQLPLTAQLLYQESSVILLQLTLSSHRHQLQLQQDEFQRQHDHLTRMREYCVQKRRDLLDQQNQQNFN